MRGVLSRGGPAEVSLYYGRPFRVIQEGQFAEAIRGAITSAEILALPPYVGSVDQFIDSTDALNGSKRFKQVYVPGSRQAS